MRIWLLLVALTLAGCTGPSDSSDQPDPGSSGIRPADGVTPGTLYEDIHENLSLMGTVEECETYCVSALAQNEGPGTYHVNNICIGPWSDSFFHGEEQLYHREPMAHCEAFGTEPFGPGESLRANFTWDGQLWNDETGEMEDAPRGNYSWHVHFDVWSESSGGERHTLTVDFSLEI